MQISARANRSAEAGSNFIIAQIDMGAAARTISRGRRFADFVFPLALETGHNTTALATPQSVKLAKTGCLGRVWRVGFCLDL